MDANGKKEPDGPVQCYDSDRQIALNEAVRICEVGSKLDVKELGLAPVEKGGEGD